MEKYCERKEKKREKERKKERKKEEKKERLSKVVEKERHKEINLFQTSPFDSLSENENVERIQFINVKKRTLRREKKSLSCSLCRPTMSCDG